MIFTLWSSFVRVMSYFSCSALYKAIYPRSSVWMYLYFVYNVIFLPSKKLILCCYPCLVMLFMIKNLARKRNKPLQCVGLR